MEAAYEQIDLELEQEESKQNGKKSRGRPKTDRGCEIPGCNNKHSAKGLCSKHYKQKRKAEQEANSDSAPAAPRGRPSLWLERKEAELLTQAIQYGLIVRYGIPTNEPDSKAMDHLAHVIKKYSDVFPLSFIQGFVRKLFPIYDPAAKPGRSTLGDLAQYAGGWYKENPTLHNEILSAEGIYIPFINDPPTEPQEVDYTAQFRIPPKQEVEGKIGQRITDDQYAAYVQENYGVTAGG